LTVKLDADKAKPSLDDPALIIGSDAYCSRRLGRRRLPLAIQAEALYSTRATRWLVAARRCWPAWPDLGDRWPSRLVATAAEGSLRNVEVAEISDLKNDYNLSLPR
jgi:hypothetical protein